MKEKLNKLLDKASVWYFSPVLPAITGAFIKFLFSIPLVLTSSAMCIINSISEDANAVLKSRISS
jgi:hypothetical protein